MVEAVPVVRSWGTHTYCYYVIQVAERDHFRRHLRKKGLAQTSTILFPFIVQPACIRYGFRSLPLPVTEAVAARILSLPMYPELTEQQRTSCRWRSVKRALLWQASSDKEYFKSRKGKNYELTDLRFGVIGWGYWGPKIARNLDGTPQAELTMVADLDARRLASACSAASPGYRNDDRKWKT